MPAPATARCWPRRRPLISCGCAMARILPARRRRSRYGESVDLGGAKVTFHPAGHVLGSAQIAVEAGGLRVVASGDYKDVPDPTCAPFELVPCDVFITEATFALPVFRHGDPDEQIAKLLGSVALFPGARASRRRLFARQGAARHRASAQSRLWRADLSARRDGEASPAIMQAAALHSANCVRCAAQPRRNSPAPSRSARPRR